MTFFSSDFKLGILGGGQLGKMLLAEARKFDIQTWVLDPSADAPCRFGAHQFFQGSLMDFDTVYEFGRQVDVLTIEIENVNLDALAQLEREGKKVYPSTTTLRKIQSKITQKKIYIEADIPTAEAFFYENKAAIVSAFANATLSFPMVWKQDRFGYDGYGVKVLRNATDLDNLPETPALIEPLIPFTHEIAVICVRSVSGNTTTYPVVEMEFHPEANQVEYVICPARLPQTILEKALQVAKQVSDTTQHVGLLAVEMFVTPDGTILVNEVAPRPHNSGHYSIEGAYTSQFENHLRAILDLPLGNTQNKTAGVMVNLVGEEGFSGPVIYKNMEQILGMPGVTPHIYGKRETRPFRKMGHVTIIHEDVNEARKKAEEVKSVISVVSM